MKLFSKENTNWVKCGKCNSEFDLYKNENGCPFCGFGVLDSHYALPNNKIESNKNFTTYLDVPPTINLKSGQPKPDKETNAWGSWLMFNSYFSGKFICRVLAWKIKNEGKDYVALGNLMKDCITLIRNNKLSELKGFPNLKKDPEGKRLVHHFISTFIKMGLIDTKSTELDSKNLLKGKWNNIYLTLTKEGLEFAKLKNRIFDAGEDIQVLGDEEKLWLLKYLKKIDGYGYKEYSNLKEVYNLLRNTNSSYKDIISWFQNNSKFKDYLSKRSKRAVNDQKLLEKQIKNYATTYASAKISLLREIGVIKNKKNDYTIIGEL